MASQAIAVGNLLSLIRYGNSGRIIPQSFMIEIVKTGLCLVGYLTDDMGIGEMTLDAGKLLVGGVLPLAVNVIHAVARPADQGIARCMITAKHDDDEDGTGDNAGRKE
jgi:hypothetical protein